MTSESASTSGSAGPAKSWSPSTTSTGQVMRARPSTVIGVGLGRRMQAARATASLSGCSARARKYCATGEISAPSPVVPVMASAIIWPDSGSWRNRFAPTPATISRWKRSGWALASTRSVRAPSENPTASTGSSGRAASTRSSMWS